MVLINIKLFLYNILEFLIIVVIDNTIVDCIYFNLIGPLFWPLWSAFVCGFFGYSLGIIFCSIFAIACLAIAFKASLNILIILIIKNQVVVYIKILNCFSLLQNINHNNKLIFYDVSWTFFYDSLTFIILFVICSISFLVHIYTYSYIFIDAHINRFYASLSLFTFFIVFLVTAGNFFQLFIGWEGVGICSFLLIGFWYKRPQVVKSAIQAVIVNKVGDLILLFAIILLILVCGTTSINALFSISTLFYKYYVYILFFKLDFNILIGFLFFVGAVAKSAQIGLHTWLLSAIEGPTPVSALLHAATIVTAGIFLIIRSQVFWINTDSVLFLIILWGAITTFFSAICGLVQHDIKKIIAFSTCSQLGYIFYACGLSEYNVCLFHLTNHAFFKALLFLCAGAVIHVLNGEQDLRRIGGLVQVLPITYIAIFIASLALIGFPFLSGFYSKDILIELAYSKYNIIGIYTFWLATISAFITAFYSIRLLYWVFLANPNFYKNNKINLVEVDSIILFVFRILIVGSIFSGFFFKDLFCGLGQNTFDWYYIFDSFQKYNKYNLPLLYNIKIQFYFDNSSLLNYTLLESEFLPTRIKLLPIYFSLCGLFCSLIIYSNKFFLLFFIKKQINIIWFQNIWCFFVEKGGFDIIYNYYIAYKIKNIAGFCYIYGDQGILELFGPQGLYFFIYEKIIVNRLYHILFYLRYIIIFSIFLLCIIIIF